MASVPRMEPSLSASYPANAWYMPYTDTPMYRDYPSPAPSDPSPAPRPPQQLDYQQQLDSSIGPTRVMRRKQGPRAFSATYSQSPLQLSPTVHPDRFPDRPSLYRPGTPSSMASPYSPYEYARHSRTRSSSNFDGRAPSPALSSASARSSHGIDATHHHPETSRAGAAAGAIRSPHKEKHTKHRLRDIDRKNICLHHIRHPNARQEDIGHHFGVERSTISKILKDKEKWLNISSEDESNEQTAKHRPSKFPEVEETMLKSLQNWSDNGTNITDHLIRQRALEIAKSFHISIDRFKGSSGWVENFKHRHDIRRGEWLRAERNPPQHLSFNLPAAHPNALATPVSIAYDQRLEAGTNTESSSSSQDSSSHGSEVPQEQQQQQQQLISPTQHWTPQTPQHQQPALVLDPTLQTASVPVPVSTHNLHHPHAEIQHSPEQVTYDYSQLYGPGIIPSGPLPSARPTLHEAEEALNTVIAFIDTEGQGILKDDERRTLGHIKHALFQYGSGVPYERPS